MVNNGKKTPKDPDELLRGDPKKKERIEILKANAEVLKKDHKRKVFAPRVQNRRQSVKGSGASEESFTPVTMEDVGKVIISLGRTATGLNVLYGRQTGYFLQERGRDIQYTSLLEVGGSPMLNLIYRRNRQDKDPRLSFDEVRDRLIIECGERPLTDESWRGQGFHRISSYLVLVSGREAIAWDGEKITKIQDPFFNEAVLRFDPTDVPVNLKAIQEGLVKMDDQAVRQVVVEKLENFLRSWCFQGGEKTIVTLLGALLARPLHACFSFRMNEWYVASPGRGKTTLLSFQKDLYGGLALYIQGSQSTAAGVMQKCAGNATKIILIDELEQAEGRERLVLLARGMSRQTEGPGGVKGTSIQKAIDLTTNVLFIFASLDQNINDEAERDRFRIINLLRNKNPYHPFDRHAVAALGVEIITLAVWSYFKAIALIKAVGHIPGFDQRLVEATITGPAMLAAALGGDAAEVRKQTVAILEAGWDTQPIVESNEERLIGDILSKKLRVVVFEDDGIGNQTRVYCDRAVSQLLEEGLFLDDLEGVGIKPCEGGIFFVPSILQQNLLRNTPWENRGIFDHLLRLPGAKRADRRCAKYPRHGILIPWPLKEGGYVAETV